MTTWNVDRQAFPEKSELEAENHNITTKYYIVFFQIYWHMKNTFSKSNWPLGSKASILHNIVWHFLLTIFWPKIYQ